MPYAYTNTIPGLVGALRQLRSVFPGQLTPDTLKKWSIAPNNETYVLNVLRFLGIIDAEGKKSPEATKAFVEHDDIAFAKKFEAMVRKAYAGLFDDFGEAAWTLNREKLIGFFRVEDESSATVGTRQAATFMALAELAGHGPPAAEVGAQPARKRERRNLRLGGRSRSPLLRLLHRLLIQRMPRRPCRRPSRRQRTLHLSVWRSP